MFQPLSNNVLVEIIEEKVETTKSGIFLPETNEKKKHSKGIVIAIGLGRLSEYGIRLPIEISVGDKILFKEPWSDDRKITDDKEYLLISEDNILGIIK